MMDLLKRMSISNGNQERKDKAYLALAQLDQPKVANWNNGLEAEFCRKIIGYAARVEAKLVQGGKV